MLKASLHTDEAAGNDFAGMGKIELLWKRALAKLTSFSYEFVSFDPSNLTNTVLVLVCHACAAACDCCVRLDYRNAWGRSKGPKSYPGRTRLFDLLRAPIPDAAK
jgi:hypothetical protein